MFNSSINEKVYHGILLELNRIIEADKLRAGDKLPSERELSERLQVGRSSVREALRALELLGLITTRRGEGTFIEHYRHNKLFDILSYYLLRDRKPKKDLLEMRVLLELDAVRLACKRITPKYIQIMEQTIAAADQKIELGIEPLEEDDEFHRAIVRASKNSVLHRIWLPVVDYSKVLKKENVTDSSASVEEHRAILAAICNRNEEQAILLLQQHLLKARGLSEQL
ncbi:transcriptional regulator [Ammoniphilus oxalaticus]|uniref:Transcriptional regulator n=1 Tax=Ammoniphilus oxalaticus TaxID=66863 RepID=A0A419SIN5_9BACL|nr:FadR/GntR family transcriptional regulator [Ammoniphilus oxalaticus]RKD23778.1 transcriptional regulator [Ammoniphilus oxalaticus]